jgi:nitrite reductase (NO-forming)
MAIQPPEVRGQPRRPVSLSPIPVQEPRRARLGWGRTFLLLFTAVFISVGASVAILESPRDDVEVAETGQAATISEDAAPAAEPVTASRIARDPSDVGTPVGARAPEHVTFELTTEEVTGQLADGKAYTYWTFGGTVPGPFLRARVGDTVTLRLTNSTDSTQPHSIDLHAVTGPGGGAAVTQVAPGETREFTFKAMNPGLYVYHCATPHIPTHIANGMYGTILIEPEGGLPPVDREFAVMQGEIYTDAPRETQGTVAYDADAMMAEHPTHVVFNGAVGSLTGEHAMQAEVGDRVRLFVGNGGPNFTSSFHVIGEIFDAVHDQGASEATHDIQTTLVPAGGAAWVEFTVDVPGSYMLVDHAITRAVDGGAAAVLHVTGDENPAIFDGAIQAGDPHAGGSGEEHGAAEETSSVTLTEFAMEPADIRLPVDARTLTVENDGAAPHELVITAAGDPEREFARTRELSSGERQELAVDLPPGTYDVACYLPGHFEAGMKGTLTVQ